MRRSLLAFATTFALLFVSLETAQAGRVSTWLGQKKAELTLRKAGKSVDRSRGTVAKWANYSRWKRHVGTVDRITSWGDDVDIARVSKTLVRTGRILADARTADALDKASPRSRDRFLDKVHDLSLAVIQGKDLGVVLAGQGDPSGPLRGPGFRFFCVRLSESGQRREQEDGGYRRRGRDHRSPVLRHDDLRSNAGQACVTVSNSADMPKRACRPAASWFGAVPR